MGEDCVISSMRKQKETAKAVAELADGDNDDVDAEDLPDRYEVGALIVGSMREAHEKVNNGRVRDRNNEKVRQSWHRVLIAGSKEYRQLLNDLELEEMKQRLDEIEAGSGGRS